MKIIMWYNQKTINTCCIDYVEKEEFLSYANKKTQTLISQHLSLNETILKRSFLIDFLNDQVKLNTILLWDYIHFESLDGIIECVSDLEMNNVSKRKEMDLKKNNFDFCEVGTKFILLSAGYIIWYHISQKMCTNYFKNMISILSLVLKTMLSWPD